MNRIVSLAVAATLLVAAAACTISNSASGPEFDPDRQPANVARITAGKTTATEVSELLGAPRRKLNLRGGQGEDWGYPYGGKYGPRIVWIEIAPNGVVRAVSDAADFDRDKRYGGL